MIPYGYCHCGCGQRTAICDRNWKRFGYVKGEPFRYLPSHNKRVRRDANIYTAKRERGESRHEHVVVAERALGRPLPPGAQVHHVDKNRRNNAPTNLVICQDQKYHHLLHVRAKVVRAGGNPNTQRVCTGCERLRSLDEFAKGRAACRACSSEYFKRWHERKSQLPHEYRERKEREQRKRDRTRAA